MHFRNEMIRKLLIYPFQPIYQAYFIQKETQNNFQVFSKLQSGLGEHRA